MSVLGKESICRYLKHRQLRSRLIITPLIEDSQVGDSSVDLRLGNDFIITRKGNLSAVDPGEKGVKQHRYQMQHHINFYEKFYLHPNELVLAGTLEYVRIPNKLSATVTSRSSWGRAGLLIATATSIAPGFTGSITLELVNHGEVPLVLYPGLRIAQLVLAECTEGSEYAGQFSCFTGPQFGNVTKDQDIPLFIKPSPAP